MLSRFRSNLMRLVAGGAQLRPADGVVLGSLAISGYWSVVTASQHFILFDPAGVPYFDYEVALWLQRLNVTIFLPLWFGFVIAGLVARKYRPEGRLLAHAFCQSYALVCTFLQYQTGPFTDLTGVMFFFAGAVGGMVLFDTGIVGPAFVTGTLAMMTFIAAEQLGFLPYGPVWAGLPVIDGQFASRQLLGPLGISYAVVILSAGLLGSVIGRLRRANLLIRRYVPDQLAEKILSGEHTAASQPERRKLTMFFSDVVGFTDASDQMEPEELLQLLNEYIHEMSGIADEFGATIDSFVGDGIMIFFGAPERTNDKDHAVRAVRMALSMQHRMGELRDRWLKEGVHQPFEIRIGIHTGIASVGDFGSQGRTTYSAIGMQVNLTARIQAECEPGHVLVSHTTRALIEGEVFCEERGEIDLKGLRYPVRVYEVMDTSSPHYRRVKDRR